LLTESIFPFYNRALRLGIIGGKRVLQLSNIKLWIGPLIGLTGLLFAIYQYYRRAKVELVVKDIFRRLAGDIRTVHENALRADTHFRNIGFEFAKGIPNLQFIRNETVDGSRDSTACSRQLALVHSKIRGIQQSFFKDTQETFPEIPSSDVKAAWDAKESELKRRSNNKSN
jgi:hypothetical protein